MAKNPVVMGGVFVVCSVGFTCSPWSWVIELWGATPSPCTP